MHKYTQLAHIQRYQISTLLKIGHLNTEIAQTIGREIARNRGKRGYRPKQAHQLAIERRDKAKRQITTSVWEISDQLIKLDWSPEQISVYLSKDQRLRISHEWIYQHIYRDKHCSGILWKHLRCRKKRRKRYSSYKKRGQIPNRVWINERSNLLWSATTID